MERNIKERVSQYVDENKVKEKLTQFFQEKIVNRKAMFIPITGVATFMLVGYAAADTKAPEITSDQIEVPYGEKFDVDTVDVTDNRDSREDIQVSANLASLNVEQLGDYKVTVTSTDSFNNETTKEVTVKEAVEACKKQIQKSESQVHAYVSMDEKILAHRIKEVEEGIKSGRYIKTKSGNGENEDGKKTV